MILVETILDFPRQTISKQFAVQWSQRKTNDVLRWFIPCPHYERYVSTMGTQNHEKWRFYTPNIWVIPLKMKVVGSHGIQKSKSLRSSNRKQRETPRPAGQYPGKTAKFSFFFFGSMKVFMELPVKQCTAWFIYIYIYKTQSQTVNGDDIFTYTLP